MTSQFAGENENLKFGQLLEGDDEKTEFDSRYVLVLREFVESSCRCLAFSPFL